MPLKIQTGSMPAAVQVRAAAIMRDKTIRSVFEARVSHYSTWAVHDGDLHIAGDFDATDVGLLVVTGDLIVDGLFEDADDPETIVCVAGALRARNLITSGWLDVGEVDVADCVVGDYNDCSAHVQGRLRARFFYPEEHFFGVGEFDVECAVGNHHRLGIDDAADRFLSSAYGIVPAENVAEVKAVLNEKYALADNGKLYLFEGKNDHRAMLKALRAGKSPLHPRARKT